MADGQDFEGSGLNIYESEGGMMGEGEDGLMQRLLDVLTEERSWQEMVRLATTLAPQVSSESSSSRSLGSNDILLASRQPSEEATSPDFSTSSLISCSEHYNGESLLDNQNMSPQSPSSPDTPEWSLIANGDSFHKVRGH